MNEHIDKNGQFQSDKYEWCKPGFVPLKLTDPMAQDLLAEYARRRRVIDASFSEAVETCLTADGFDPAKVYTNLVRTRVVELPDGERRMEFLVDTEGPILMKAGFDFNLIVHVTDGMLTPEPK